MTHFRPLDILPACLRLCRSLVSGLVIGAAIGSPSILQAQNEDFETVEVPTPAWARHLEVTKQTDALLAAHDTAGLEKLADELRKSGERMDGGTWLLSTFYDRAVDVPEKPEAERAAMDFYEKWARDRPENITAQVCLVSALTDYAWNARGSGYADTVTDEGWKNFHDRLERAREVLDRASTLKEKCPGWFSAAQTVALGQGWDRVEYMIMVNEAIRLYPTFGHFYTRACYWLLPRWYGEVGDFEKWIAEQADQYPEAERDLEYARFVWMADRMRMSSEIVFAKDRLDWKRTKRGFENWLGQKPGNLMVQFEFLRLAVLADDRETARAMFEATGGKYFPPMWKVDRFREARAYAFEDGPNPYHETEASASTPSFPPEAREMTKMVAHHLGQAIGGVLVGVLLFTLAAQRQRLLAGSLALVASIALAAAFGTYLTVIPALVLLLVLRRGQEIVPPPVSGPRPWVVLGWVVLLGVIYLGLSTVAVIFALIPPLMDLGAHEGNRALDILMRDGTVFRIAATTAWLALLTLLVICGRQNEAGWRSRLSLHSCRSLSALGWTALGAVLLVGLIALESFYLDERTREAVELMAKGMDSPWILFFAMVVAAPVVEELIFRGYAYAGWIDKWGFWITGLLTTVIFTGLHVQYGWVGLIGIFGMGFVLFLVRWKTGSVYPCIALHAFNNLLSFVAMAFPDHH